MPLEATHAAVDVFLTAFLALSKVEKQVPSIFAFAWRYQIIQYD